MTIKLTRVNAITKTCTAYSFSFIFLLKRLLFTDISYYSSHSSSRSGSIGGSVVGGGDRVVVGGGGDVVVGGCVGG